jgi:uncharacterized protein (TIGR03435 family)
MTRLFAGLSLIALAAGALLGQTAAPPAFEVAVIKPVPPAPLNGNSSSAMRTTPGRVEYTNVSLKDVVVNAYKLMPYQVNGPDWMGSERFDISAKVPEGAKRDQIMAMMQTLLGERFKMKVHRETREQSAYVLLVGKNGPKLTASPEPVATQPGADGGKRDTGSRSSSRSDGQTVHFEMRRMTIADFAKTLGAQLQRPVVDETGLTGKYDIDLDFAVADLGGGRNAAMVGPAGDAGPAMASAPGASIFGAVQQLGLKLETRKAPVEYLIVDSVEKTPTEN